MFKGEKLFESERTVKYCYQKSYKKTKSLVIVFSAFSAVGKKPAYNFVRTLKEFDCNKLFILDDFGCRASYYLCENREFSIENSVMELINHIIKENEIDHVITCGSSKGGYAALYYGIKYGFDHIFAASPQYLLGDYLMDQTNSDNVATFMSGSTEENDKEFLNSIMESMISKTIHKPNIFIHLGKDEMHYHSHVKPLLEKLKEKELDYQLDLGDYSKHSDVAKFFPQILKDKVRGTLGYPSLAIEETIKGEYSLNTSGEFKALTDSPNNKVAWYLLHDGERIDLKGYSLDRTYTSTFNKKGNYEIVAFAINDKNLKVTVKSDVIEIE